MQITGFSAVESEMSYVLLSSIEAATRIKSRLPCPCREPALTGPDVSWNQIKPLTSNLIRGQKYTSKLSYETINLISSVVPEKNSLTVHILG